MHGEWKHCMIHDKDLECIWPIHEEDQLNVNGDFSPIGIRG